MAHVLLEADVPRPDDHFGIPGIQAHAVGQLRRTVLPPTVCGERGMWLNPRSLVWLGPSIFTNHWIHNP